MHRRQYKQQNEIGRLEFSDISFHFEYLAFVVNNKTSEFRLYFVINSARHEILDSMSLNFRIFNLIQLSKSETDFK